MKKQKELGNYEKTIVIPVKKEMWKALRIMSFERETSMSQITREALQKYINRNEKSVDTK